MDKQPTQWMKDAVTRRSDQGTWWSGISPLHGKTCLAAFSSFVIVPIWCYRAVHYFKYSSSQTIHSAIKFIRHDMQLTQTDYTIPLNSHDLHYYFIMILWFMRKSWINAIKQNETGFVVCLSVDGHWSQWQGGDRTKAVNKISGDHWGSLVITDGLWWLCKYIETT